MFREQNRLACVTVNFISTFRAAISCCAFRANVVPSLALESIVERFTDIVRQKDAYWVSERLRKSNLPIIQY